jgi:hypothetical protein
MPDQQMQKAAPVCEHLSVLKPDDELQKEIQLTRLGLLSLEQTADRMWMGSEISTKGQRQTLYDLNKNVVR